MAKRLNQRIVARRGDGWAVVKPGSSRASSTHRTQAAAIRRGRQVVRNTGGGELRIQGRDGRFRDSDTVPPGNDPFPPRDKR